MDVKQMVWVREPKEYTIHDGEIRIITEPGTDLWQRTYYGFQNDNAPVLQLKTAEKYFRRYIEKEICRKAICLPSTSPANAAFSLDRLIDEWRAAIKG